MNPFILPNAVTAWVTGCREVRRRRAEMGDNRRTLMYTLAQRHRRGSTKHNHGNIERQWLEEWWCRSPNAARTRRGNDFCGSCDKCLPWTYCIIKRLIKKPDLTLTNMSIYYNPHKNSHKTCFSLQIACNVQCMYSTILYRAACVAQVSKALHLSARGVTTDPGIDWESPVSSGFGRGRPSL